MQQREIEDCSQFAFTSAGGSIRLLQNHPQRIPNLPLFRRRLLHFFNPRQLFAAVIYLKALFCKSRKTTKFDGMMDDHLKTRLFGVTHFFFLHPYCSALWVGFLEMLMEGSPCDRLTFGKMGYGCKHYRRRCRIRAPCCNEVYDCRHCHNEAMSMLRNIYDRHELVRYDVKQVICSVCDTEQPVARVCMNCGVNMGEYFCEICKFYDDDIDKGQFHCDDCGICRIGGRENFFHCNKCGSCYSTNLRNNHHCVEDSMRHHCPICYEYLFDSLKDVTVMKCGHTMHSECYNELIKRDRFCCPICSKSIMDMSRAWKLIDEEVEATVMPEEYRYKKVWILCNDCNDTTEVFFHIIGQKCSHCESYNTRTIAPPVFPQ